MAGEVLPDCHHSVISVHSRHVEIHQNQVVAGVLLQSLLEVLFYHLKSLVT